MRNGDPKQPALQLEAELTESTVQAMVSVASWEEAADRIGHLLIDAGAVKPSYVEAMKRVLREMGPYAVIAPGIVLLHARPEDGVLRPCFAMITLATPVPFGNERHDPVDLVIAFGAVDKEAHIAALGQLAELLMDEDALKEIRSAKDSRELLATVRSWTRR
jgi:mannitol/fructose-specific phosphotransferase system IIA component (Ntr-type)